MSAKSKRQARDATESVSGTLYRTPLAYAYADHIPETLTELRKALKPLKTKKLTVSIWIRGGVYNQWVEDGVPQGSHLWLLYNDEAIVHWAGFGPACVVQSFRIRQAREAAKQRPRFVMAAPKKATLSKHDANRATKFVAFLNQDCRR